MDQYGAGASPCRSCSPTMKAAPPPPRRARVADAERRALGLRGGRAEGIDWSLEPWSGGPWASHLVGLAIRLCLSLGRCLPSMLDARERAVGNRRPARRGAAGALEDYRRRQGCSGATTAVAGAAAPPCGMGSSAHAAGGAARGSEELPLLLERPGPHTLRDLAERHDRPPRTTNRMIGRDSNLGRRRES